MRTILTSLLALLLILSACDTRSFTNQDPWLNHPIDSGPANGKPLSRSLFAVVAPTYESDAEQRLANTSWVILDPDDAEKFSATPLPPTPGTQCYLLRAVYIDGSSGAFDVLVFPTDDV